MPAIVRKRASGYVVLSHAGEGGKVLGRHKTRTEAEAQRAAVNTSLYGRPGSTRRH